MALEIMMRVRVDGGSPKCVVRTDGARTWHPDDLDSVTDAAEGDPSWLQIQAAVNRLASTGAPSPDLPEQ